VSKRAFYWAELKTTDFRNLNPENTIAILPVAATEQHGPHLPVMTDTAIAQGMLDLLEQHLPPDLTVLVLPIQSIGKSNEHLLSPGTLSLSAETLQRVLIETCEGVYRAGLRKLVLANSHGGIHAGDIETSLMLSFRSDLVSMANAKNFVSSAIAMEKEFKHLGPTGTHAFGWIAQDLNVDGGVGDASKATADKGIRTAEHQIDGFIALLRDMTAFSLDRLYTPNAN